MEEWKSQLVRTRQENYKGGKTKKKQTWTLIRLDSAERSNEMPKKLRGHLPFSPYRAPWISLIFCRASGSEKILLCYCQILKNYIYYLTWLVISHELLGQLLRFFFFSTWVTFSSWERILTSSCLLSCSLDLSLSFSCKASAYIWRSERKED